jgi:hypothetical protein
MATVSPTFASERLAPVFHGCSDPRTWPASQGAGRRFRGPRSLLDKRPVVDVVWDGEGFHRLVMATTGRPGWSPGDANGGPHTGIGLSRGLAHGDTFRPHMGVVGVILSRAGSSS